MPESCAGPRLADILLAAPVGKCFSGNVISRIRPVFRTPAPNSKSMKSIFAHAMLAALLASASAYGQTEAKTTPVGYVSLGNTSGGNAVPANTDVAVSVPLANPTEFAGIVASVTSTTLTVSGSPGWSTNKWAPNAATPYHVAIGDGSQKGLMGLVTGNTADTLTITLVNGASLASVPASSSVKIFKAWTLKTMFPALPVGTRVLAFSGNVAGENLASDLQYVFSGTAWLQTVGGSGNADNVILYPGESFLIRTGNNPIVSLSIAGEIPTFSQRGDLVKLSSANQDNRISFFSPVDVVIGQSGLGFTPGDRLLVFDNAATGQNKAASIILVWSGSDWIGLAGVSGSQGAVFKLKAGQGYVYRRASTAPVGTVDWIADQPYAGAL